MKMDKKLVIEVGVAALLVALAVVWRLVNNVTMAMPNLELVTAASIVAGALLRRPMGAAVPVAVMFLSDLIIGNTGIAWFTWSAFLLIGLSSVWLKRFNGQDGKLVAASAGTGLWAALFFFVWTNFGVWLMGDGNVYPHTLTGLMQCYAMGIPFFRGTLLSGAVLTPALMALALYAPRLLQSKQLKLARA